MLASGAFIKIESSIDRIYETLQDEIASLKLKTGNGSSIIFEYGTCLLVHRHLF